MSFSSDIKKELAGRVSERREEQIAEIAAIIRFTGTVDVTPDNESIEVETEQVSLAKKYLKLLKAAFQIPVDLEISKRPNGRNNKYRILLNKQGESQAPEGAATLKEVLHDAYDWDRADFVTNLLADLGCARSFVRGAFLSSGSMSDPGKSYHFEVVCKDEPAALGLQRIVEQFDLSPKIVVRKGKYIVYIKDSTKIVDVLNVMEAHQALMQLENIRIIKDMKNSANRQFNCDSANINKMVKAATKQLDDIRYIESTVGLKSLTPQLREMAIVRLEHPDVSLQELGAYLTPSVGKSGVNHRLKKIGEIAEQLRQQNVI